MKKGLPIYLLFAFLVFGVLLASNSSVFKAGYSPVSTLGFEKPNSNDA